ncbi:hypothetical protein BsWGS_24022 [Bradybaena similaris]
MNGDDTLDWAKKPAVPDNRKRAVTKKTIDGWPASRFCPRCALDGNIKPIHLFQINDEEALLMCKNEECTFMQSTYWESLIIKRSISQLPTRRKTLSSLSSSRLSTLTGRNTSTRLQNISKSASLSRYSVPFNTSSSASPGISPLPSLTGVTVSSSRPLAQRLRDSSVPQESSLKGPERKALVPIAPFLSGHAHNFASFQTNQLEHKLLQRNGGFVQQLKGSPSTLASQPKDTRTPLLASQSKDTRTPLLASQAKDTRTPLLASQPKDTRTPNVTNKRKTSSKRRACSLDSDSQSSSSSSCSYSRPTTPETAPAGKKVRSIVVDPETLSKLIDGSLKLEIRKSKDSGADIIFRSVKKVNPTEDYSKHPEVENKTQKVNELVNGDPAESINTVPAVSGIQKINSGDLEITPVGSLEDIINSRGPLTNAVSYHIENSIKSHIDIINSHIQAINNAVGCSDLYVPLDFSHLCQKLLNNASSSLSSSDQSELEKCVTDSSPVYPNSVVPVGQTALPVEASADSSSLTPGKTTSEEIDFQNHTSSS